MSRWLKEPLLHFLLIGAGLFALFYQVADPEAVAENRIQITAADVDRMGVLFERKWQRPPSPKEMDGLIEAQIREEVLYREALAMGLDEDDTIVRRRMAQKLEFLFKDLAEASDPSDGELQAFYEASPDEFMVPGKMSFEHIYLGADERAGEAAAQAAELLPALNAEPEAVDSTSHGDRFMLGHRFDRQSPRQVTSMFGRAFAAAVAAMDPGAWRGPVGSGYGLHLVFVREHTPEHLPPMAEIRQTVLREYLAERRRETDRVFYRTLRDRYTVVVERPEGTSQHVAGVLRLQ